MATPFHAPRQDGLSDLAATLTSAVSDPTAGTAAEGCAALSQTADAHLARVSALLDQLRRDDGAASRLPALDARLLLLEVAEATAALRRTITLVRAQLTSALDAAGAAPSGDETGT